MPSVARQRTYHSVLAIVPGASCKAFRFTISTPIGSAHSIAAAAAPTKGATVRPVAVAAFLDQAELAVGLTLPPAMPCEAAALQER